MHLREVSSFYVYFISHCILTNIRLNLDFLNVRIIWIWWIEGDLVTPHMCYSINKYIFSEMWQGTEMCGTIQWIGRNLITVGIQLELSMGWYYLPGSFSVSLYSVIEKLFALVLGTPLLWLSHWPRIILYTFRGKFKSQTSRSIINCASEI